MKSRRLKVFVGIDGGGSKTLALAVDEQGHELGRGVAGPSNYHVTGVPAAYKALDLAVTTALASVSAECQLVALCLGMAGAGRPADRAVLRAWADVRYPHVPTRLVHDAALLLAAGTPEGWGVALISGTGALAYGEDHVGRNARAGGWGYLLGDEGSGYATGLAGLRAVARAADGRGPQTTLTAAVLAHWGLDAPPDLIRYVYRQEVGREAIAALAALVDAAAGARDGVAQALVAEAGRELALAIQSVAQQLDFTCAFPCALAGGLLVKGHSVREALFQAAEDLGLELSPVALVKEPAVGAVRLALRKSEWHSDYVDRNAIPLY